MPEPLYPTGMPGDLPDDPLFLAYWRAIAERQVRSSLNEFLKVELLPVPNPLLLTARLADLGITTGQDEFSPIAIFFFSLDEDFHCTTSESDIARMDTLGDVVKHYSRNVSLTAREFMLRSARELPE